MMRNLWRVEVSESIGAAEKRWDAALLALCLGVVGTLYAYNRQPYSLVSWLDPSAPPVYRSHEEYLLVNCLMLLLPLIVLVSAGGALRTYNLSGGNRWGWMAAAACYLLMLPLLWWASARADFQQTYPLYRPARYAIPALLYHELTYTFYLWCWEMFFRAVLTSICWRWLGWMGIALQSLAFALLHIGKPMPEVAGSFVAGMALGGVAVRAQSFVPGFVCHALVSATMDMFVLIRAR
ncbi:MAG: CPBP family intramembrane glutamic endopeptidase [Armatimonadota bacterium]|nr:CPBP family intramembrane metalloprotease [bacterium]MDW8320263.1 CPBP family intramembrane glutamic endopeptidase [Armatimonadota bacterium]